MIFNSGRQWFDGFTTAPTSGSYSVGALCWNSNPVPSGNLGWICTTAGTACNVAWSASTVYSLNQLVYSGSNVYICTQAGTSGSIAPSGTSTSITDGTVGWAYVNPLAVFKTFGTIGG